MPYLEFALRYTGNIQLSQNPKSPQTSPLTPAYTSRTTNPISPCGAWGMPGGGGKLDMAEAVTTPGEETLQRVMVGLRRGFQGQGYQRCRSVQRDQLPGFPSERPAGPGALSEPASLSPECGSFILPTGGTDRLRCWKWRASPLGHGRVSGRSEPAKGFCPFQRPRGGEVWSRGVFCSREVCIHSLLPPR